MISRSWRIVGAFVRSLVGRAGQASFRFPAAAFAVLALGVVANYLVRSDAGPSDFETRLAFALAAGAAGSVAATLLAEGLSYGRTTSFLLGFVGLALAGFFVGTASPLIIYGPAVALAILAAIPLAPFVRRGSSCTFWNFALWTSVGVTLAWLSVAIFLLGFTAIFEMVRYLFGVGLGGRAYSHLFTTALVLVGPLFALGRIPDPRKSASDQDVTARLTETVRPLFEWVSAPLVLTAAVLIHLFAGRILLTGDIPTGGVGWIVLLFAGFVLWLRVAMEPYLDRLQAPGQAFVRTWAFVLVTPLALLTYALQLRISSEGWTVARYYVGLAALGVALVLIMQLPRRTRGDIRFVVAVVPVLLLLSTFGPWGVAQTVARSQTARIISDYGSSIAGGPGGMQAMPMDERNRLRSRLAALEDVGQEHALASSLSAFGTSDAERLAALNAAVRYFDDAQAAANQGRSLYFRTGGSMEVGGYDRVFPAVTADRIEPSAVATAWLDGGALVVRYRNVSDRFDLDEFLVGVQAGSDGGEGPVADLRSPDGRSIRMQLSSASWSADGRPLQLNGVLALRHGEWAP